MEPITQITIVSSLKSALAASLAAYLIATPSLPMLVLIGVGVGIINIVSNILAKEKVLKILITIPLSISLVVFLNISGLALYNNELLWLSLSFMIATNKTLTTATVKVLEDNFAKTLSAVIALIPKFFERFIK